MDRNRRLSYVSQSLFPKVAGSSPVPRSKIEFNFRTSVPAAARPGVVGLAHRLITVLRHREDGP